jgi:hypothetical protein
VHDDVVLRRITGLLVPPAPGRPEQEAEVVDVPVVLALLDVLAVLLRLLPEPGIAGVLGEQPQLPAQETLAPVRPQTVVVGHLPGSGVGGTVTAAVRAALAPISIAYSPIIGPIRFGANRLRTSTGARTFITAIAAEATTVPANSPAMFVERTRRPTVRTIIATSSPRSSPILPRAHAPNGANRPIHSGGIVVSTVTGTDQGGTATPAATVRR